MTMTATINEAGHVILPEPVLRLFDLHGECQLEVEVLSNGVRLRFGTPRQSDGPKSVPWFTPFTQPAGTPLIKPETISQAVAEDGF
jgi:hypothetical protein